MRVHQIGWLGLGSGPGIHGTCTCKPLVSSRVLRALSCGWACLSECSKKTQRWTYSQQPVSGPSDSKPGSHLLRTLPFVESLQRFRVNASLQMNEEPKYFADQPKWLIHLHTWRNSWSRTESTRHRGRVSSGSLRSDCSSRQGQGDVLHEWVVLPERSLCQLVRVEASRSFNCLRHSPRTLAMILLL